MRLSFNQRSPSRYANLGARDADDGAETNRLGNAELPLVQQYDIDRSIWPAGDVVDTHGLVLEYITIDFQQYDHKLIKPRLKCLATWLLTYHRFFLARTAIAIKAIRGG